MARDFLVPLKEHQFGPLICKIISCLNGGDWVLCMKVEIIICLCRSLFSTIGQAGQHICRLHMSKSAQESWYSTDLIAGMK